MEHTSPQGQILQDTQQSVYDGTIDQLFTEIDELRKVIDSLHSSLRTSQSELCKEEEKQAEATNLTLKERLDEACTEITYAREDLAQLLNASKEYFGELKAFRL